jgi:NAD(P)H-hydrate epimerase
MAALRGGAGLVTVACPTEIAAIVAGFEPSYMTLPLATDSHGGIAMEASAAALNHQATVIAVGPGLGQGGGAWHIVAELIQKAKMPLVLDADALNVTVGRTELLRKRAWPTVITPHPGEFARLACCTIAEVQSNREEAAVRLARELSVVVVLKGHRTVISDGVRMAINETGNPGMATGGTGDVLTGLVAAILGQGMSPFASARLAVHVHSLAGDIAASVGNPVSLIARDLIDALPAAWRQVAKDA